jgi:hypothetical protein
MHPVTIHAVVAERSTYLQASAAAAQQAKQARRGRRAQQAGRPSLFTRIARAGRGPQTRPVRRLLRDSRTA